MTDIPDFTAQRRAMIDSQLIPRGIVNPRVLAAMAEVPRERFVPKAFHELAYADSAVGIGQGQTISQPFTVAYMCQACQLHGDERVLEIGTGSGYGAAVLSQLAREVFTIERISRFALEAQGILKSLGYTNVVVVEGDGRYGLASAGPFDAIVVTAGASEVPEALMRQLAEGGRLVIPIGNKNNQRMLRYMRRGEHFVSEDLGGFVFVPFVGASEI